MIEINPMIGLAFSEAVMVSILLVMMYFTTRKSAG